MIGCDTRPQFFLTRQVSLHPYKISDLYDSPNPFKNFETERASCLLVRALANVNSIHSIFKRFRIAVKIFPQVNSLEIRMV
jgi:hypothetical protein